MLRLRCIRRGLAKCKKWRVATGRRCPSALYNANLAMGTRRRHNSWFGVGRSPRRPPIARGISAYFANAAHLVAILIMRRIWR